MEQNTMLRLCLSCYSKDNHFKYKADGAPLLGSMHTFLSTIKKILKNLEKRLTWGPGIIRNFWDFVYCVTFFIPGQNKKLLQFLSLSCGQCKLMKDFSLTGHSTLATLLFTDSDVRLAWPVQSNSAVSTKWQFSCRRLR